MSTWRLRWARLGLLLAALGLASGASPDSFGKVRETIRAELARGQIPSISVAVARNGTIVWEEGFGWADREGRVRASEHAIYSLASISKPFTATALMTLVERGAIDLDAPINRYLGDAKLTVHVGRDEDVTVRRIANHSAGLGLHYHFFYADEPWARPSPDETIRRYGHIVTAPGERFFYSNLGYGLLEYVIARASGRSYEHYLRDEVLLPLGLSRSIAATPPGLLPELAPHQAIRYGSDQRPLPFYDFDHRGGSSVFASAHDLVRFGMFHTRSLQPDQRAILKPESVTRMQEATSITPTGAGYGIGWRSEKRGRYTVVSHSGGMAGVSTILLLVPAERIVVVALANARTDLPGRIAEDILATVLPDLPAPKPPAPAGEPPAFTPAADMVGEWTGAITTSSGPVSLTLRIADGGDVRVRLQRPGQLWTLLNMVSDRDGFLTGRFMGDLGAEDTDRYRHLLEVTLKRRGRSLAGAVTTVPATAAPRVRNALTHWVELKKH